MEQRLGDVVRSAAGLVLQRRSIRMLALCLLVGILASWHFETSPPTWYDEGVNLQAARNLARLGKYGLVYADAVLPFDLQLTTGPTVIVPIALAFKTFGFGLAQGRIVMVLYTLLAALGLYRVGSLLYGATVGGLAVLVLCATDRASPAVTRDVVGEVVALAFLFWGVALFVAARTRGGAVRYLWAGLLFGFAVLTKGQFALLLPAIVSVWLLTRGQPGGFARRDLLLMLTVGSAPPALWQLYQMLNLGLVGFVDHFRYQSASLSVSAIVLPLNNLPLSRALMLTATRSLLSSQWSVLGLAGLTYVWIAAVARGWRNEAAERLLLPTFASAWLVWYLGFSVGYGRYMIPLVAICSLFLAVLLCDPIQRLRPSRNVEAKRGPRILVADPVWTGLLLLPVTLILSGIMLQLLTVRLPPERGAQEIAGLISREVEPSASTESFEWQLDLLTERRFHHPPPFVPAIPYDVPAATEYLVDGPMSKDHGLYTSELKQHKYQFVASAGPYDLYHREPLP